MPLKHDDFTLTRVIAAAPATVFRAWADPAIKRKWFVDSDGPLWQERDYALDFRIGGRESGRFVLTRGPGAGEHANATTYLDIVPDERIVYAYTMAMNGVIHSSSLATVELAAQGDGTCLTLTEHVAFTDASDGATGRTQGWTHLLDALRTVVETADA